MHHLFIILYHYRFFVQILDAIDKLNKDPAIHGIIVQLPLDCVENIDTNLCTNHVAVSKDVDG